MHIDRANEVTVSREPTSPACPISSLGLMFMPTSRTLTRCSSFGASEARDVSLFGLVGEIVDLLALFPQRHTLVVVSSFVLAAYTARRADEERANLLLYAEVDDLTCGLVPHLTYATFSTSALLVFSAVQLLPSARTLLATGLLFGKLPQVSIALSCEGADTTSGHHHGLSCIGRSRCQMDFSQVDRRMNRTWGLLFWWGFHPHMQFKAVLPDQRPRSTVFRQIKRQDKRSTSPPHWQNHSPRGTYNSLSRPGDGVEAFRAPGILHPHPRVFLPQDACRLDVGKEGMHNHLHRLARASQTALWWPFATHHVPATSHVRDGLACVFPCTHSTPEPLPYGGLANV
jgi:hypothetical protein